MIPVPLVAERGRSASFDLTRSLGPISYTTTLFGSSVRHPINVERGEHYELTSPSGPTKNVGVEFLATLRKAPFSATASYTFVQSTQQESGQRVQSPLTPRHSFGIVGMWEKEKGRIGIESYLHGSPTSGGEPVPYRVRALLSLRFFSRTQIRPGATFSECGKPC